LRVLRFKRSLKRLTFMLSRWRKEYREGKIVADRRVKRVVDVELQTKIKGLKKLEADNAKLRVQNDLLKKAMRCSSARSKKSLNL